MSDAPQTPTPSEGLSESAASGLAYITIIPAIIFLVVAPYNTNPKIKFHAWQNIFLVIGWFIASVILIIPILGWIIGALSFLVLFVLWVFALINGFQGKQWKIPFIGEFAAKQAGLTS
jgi:uncharacterized membrane protein